MYRLHIQLTQDISVIFLGSKQFGFHCLEEIFELDPLSICAIITIDDRDDSRSAYKDFHAFANDNRVKLFVTQNRLQTEELIRALRPDLCLVSGWYWLISPETLNSVPRGFIGIHNSILPRYRGGSPLVWTIINGEQEAGVTLFSFTAGLDDGDIWGQKTVKIESTDYISDVLSKLEEKAISILREKYAEILEGKAKAYPQNGDEATYCAQRFPFDGLIDWRKTSFEIYNFVRAQSEPYPGAFTMYNGKKLTIWRAHPEDITYYGTPGQIARINDNGVYVICGNQKPLVLDVVELEGEGVKVSANKVISSIRIRF
jgi:methionyl-tRNA formyltransferase